MNPLVREIYELELANERQRITIRALRAQLAYSETDRRTRPTAAEEAEWRRVRREATHE